MKKQIIDFQVIAIERSNDIYSKLTLTPADGTPLSDIHPGQFVEVSVPGPTTLLRRPISVHDFDSKSNTLTLYVRRAGDATRRLCESAVGDVYNIVLPLGNGFPTDLPSGSRVLLIGGGIGIAPLLYYAKWLKANGYQPAMAFGAQTADMFLAESDFEALGTVAYATNDGSRGHNGFVTELLGDTDADIWCVCGPMPMMKAVAAIARERGVKCYVSLENTMACGLGACLCCVEKTTTGNRCVCTDGPVFEISELTW